MLKKKKLASLGPTAYSSTCPSLQPFARLLFGLHPMYQVLFSPLLLVTLRLKGRLKTHSGSHPWVCPHGCQVQVVGQGEQKEGGIIPFVCSFSPNF